MAPAVAAPIILAIFLFSFAVVYTLRAFIAAMFQTLINDLKAIPVIGGKLASPLEGIAQAVSNALGAAEGRIDQALGASMHAMARLTEWTWREFKAHSGVIAAIASITANLATGYHALKSLIHHTAHGIAGVLPRVKTLEKEWHGIEHRVGRIEREIGKGIGHDLRIQVKALEGEVAKVEDKIIPNIRSIAQGAEADVTALRKWVSDHALVAGTTAFAGAVAWAIGRLGLGGLRCSGLLNSLNKRGCGFWNGLEDLLGLFVDTLLLTNVCTLVPVLESAVSAVADPLVIALTDVGAGLCSGGIGPSPALAVPPLSLPASPGFTLNLP